MSFTYDPSTTIGKVRRTLPDKSPSNPFWTDEEIQSFIDDEGDWRLATALALETMASDIVLVMQVMKVQNIQTDSSKVSAELLKRASVLRKLYTDAALVADGAFDVIEIITNDFGYREKLYGDLLRH